MVIMIIKEKIQYNNEIELSIPDMIIKCFESKKKQKKIKLLIFRSNYKI